MHRLRWLGIELLGSRNRALQELVSQIPPPVVAKMLGYSDQVTQKHAAEAGNTWAMYASTDRANTSAKPTGRTMTTDSPADRPPIDADEQPRDTSEPTLFDLDPPLRPYDVHIDSLVAAAAALEDARKTFELTKQQLAQTVHQAHQAGLSWAKIAEIVGVSPQAAYQRWAVRLRQADDVSDTISGTVAGAELL
ncbi:hypothetical protein JKJ01_11535 [Mycolicibacterium fortuitum]|nr:hypothetical protein [Mycolicibacterium fortuitum]